MALSPSELNDIEVEKAKRDAKETVVNGRRFRKIFFTGRSEAGKTTLVQALKEEEIRYTKTQYVNSWDAFIDMPGEYNEFKDMGFKALYAFSFESELEGILVGADEPFGLINPGIPTAINRPLIGIITKCDTPNANVPMARQWLENASVERIFEVDSITGRGIKELRDYLLMPIEKAMSLEEAIERQTLGQSEWTRY